MAVTLYGADYSVYARIVRLALEEKGVEYTVSPIDIFAEGGPPPGYLEKHPFMSTLTRMLLMPLFAIGLSSCNDEWSWHQKLTVSVVTPTGLKTASSVQRGTIVDHGWWGRQWGYGGSVSLKGEAVALEVAPGKFLFALISSTPNAWKIFVPEKKEKRQAGSALAVLRETRELPLKQYPLLVTFGDINDPASVQRVNPNNLEAAFGPGYRLNSITMTITDEPVTSKKVEEVLGWLETVGRERVNLKGKPLKGLISEQSDPGIYMITPIDFSTELLK